MTFSHSKSDERSGENDSDDETSPTPLIEENNDDDDPPAAGAAMILETDDESKHGLTVSLAPTAEPKHEAEPTMVTA